MQGDVRRGAGRGGEADSRHGMEGADQAVRIARISAGAASAARDDDGGGGDCRSAGEYAALCQAPDDVVSEGGWGGVAGGVWGGQGGAGCGGRVGAAADRVCLKLRGTGNRPRRPTGPGGESDCGNSSQSQEPLSRGLSRCGRSGARRETTEGTPLTARNGDRQRKPR